MYHHINTGSKRISSSEDIVETVIFFIIWALTVTLTLKIANPSFCMTLWCITKSSLVRNVKWFGKYHLDKHSMVFQPSLWPWSWILQSIFFLKTLWLTIMYHQTKFVCQRISCSEDTVEWNIFWSYEPCDLDLYVSKHFFFLLHDTLAYDAASL